MLHWMLTTKGTRTCHLVIGDVDEVTNKGFRTLMTERILWVGVETIPCRVMTRGAQCQLRKAWMIKKLGVVTGWLLGAENVVEKS